MCNVLLTSCEDGVCRLWSETLLPEDSLLGGQISENTHSFSSSLPGLAGNKDKIQHALEVQLLHEMNLNGRQKTKKKHILYQSKPVYSWAYLVNPPPEASATGSATVLCSGGAQ